MPWQEVSASQRSAPFSTRSWSEIISVSSDLVAIAGHLKSLSDFPLIMTAAAVVRRRHRNTGRVSNKSNETTKSSAGLDCLGT